MAFVDTFERVLNSTNLRNQKELADFIGIKPQQVTKQKNKDTFPLDWAFKIAQHYNLSTDWIMTGKEPTISGKSDFLSIVDEWLSEIEKNEPQRRLYFESDFLDFFPKFKIWKEKKNEETQSYKSGVSKVA